MAALRASARRQDFAKRIDLARQAIAGGEFDGARRLLDQLRAEDPRSATAMVERARVSIQSDSLDAGRVLLESALEIGSETDRYDALVNLAVLAMRRGDVARGLAYFEQANQLRPTETSAWVYRARALAMGGKTNEARLVLDQARSQVFDRAAIETALNQLATTGTIP